MSFASRSLTEPEADLAESATVQAQSAGASSLVLGLRSNSPTSTAISKKPRLNSSEAAALAELQLNSRHHWDLRRDNFSGRIRTLFSGQLELKRAAVREAGDDFVKTYSQDLFGVDPSRVMFSREEVTDRTRLIYDQIIDGVPVYGATLSLFFENGSLTRIQNDLAPFGVEANSKPSLLSDAFASYRETQSGLYDVKLQDSSSNRVVLYPNGRTLVYVSEFVTNERNQNAEAENFHVLFNEGEKFIIQRRRSAVP